MYYYKDGFYSTDVHTEIPTGAVEISADEYQRLMQAQTAGEEIYSKADGTPASRARQPSEHHSWTNGKWTLTAAAKSAQLADAKAEKLTALSAAAQRYVYAAAQADVPDFELLTWSTQAAEAKAWHADNNTPTPTLDAIAAARGIDVDTLRQKTYAKATAYEQLAANIAGQRQAIEDKIKAADNIDALDAIDIVFSVGDAA